MRNRTRPAPNQTTGTGIATPIPVLLASFHAEDQRGVPALLQGTRWLAIKVARWNDVLQLIRSVVVPVMLCDRDVPPGNYQQTLADLRQLPRSPRVVVLSDPSSAALSEDFALDGVFDLLYRPLCQGKLLTALELAFAHWEQSCGGVARSAV